MKTTPAQHSVSPPPHKESSISSPHAQTATQSTPGRATAHASFQSHAPSYKGSAPATARNQKNPRKSVPAAFAKYPHEKAATACAQSHKALRRFLQKTKTKLDRACPPCSFYPYPLLSSPSLHLQSLPLLSSLSSSLSSLL